MGQRANSTSLRLKINQKWKSDWVSEKKNYSNLLFLDLELKKYFSKLLAKEDFIVTDIYIKKNMDKVIIYIYFNNSYSKDDNKLNNQIFIQNIKHNLYNFIKQTNYVNNINKIDFFFYNVSINSFKLNKKVYIYLKKFKNYQKNFNMMNMIKKTLNIIHISFFLKNASILSQFLALNLQKTKRHRFFIFKTKTLLNKCFKNYSSIIKGYRIEFKGRLNGASRSKKLILRLGKNSLNTLESNIKYDSHQFLTSFGICNVKVWLFF